MLKTLPGYLDSITRPVSQCWMEPSHAPLDPFQKFHHLKDTKLSLSQQLRLNDTQWVSLRAMASLQKKAVFWTSIWLHSTLLTVQKDNPDFFFSVSSPQRLIHLSGPSVYPHPLRSPSFSATLSSARSCRRLGKSSFHRTYPLEGCSFVKVQRRTWILHGCTGSTLPARPAQKHTRCTRIQLDRVHGLARPQSLRRAQAHDCLVSCGLVGEKKQQEQKHHPHVFILLDEYWSVQPVWKSIRSKTLWWLPDVLLITKPVLMLFLSPWAANVSWKSSPAIPASHAGGSDGGDDAPNVTHLTKKKKRERKWENTAPRAELTQHVTVRILDGFCIYSFGIVNKSLKKDDWVFCFFFRRSSRASWWRRVITVTTRLLPCKGPSRRESN